MGLLAYLIAGIALVGALGGLYWRVDHGGYERGKGEVQVAWDAANEDARDRERTASLNAAKGLADERAKRRTITQEVTTYVDREVEKLVYRSICLPDTGLCLANAAISGAVPAGCFSDGAVPLIKPPG